MKNLNPVEQIKQIILVELEKMSQLIAPELIKIEEHITYRQKELARLVNEIALFKNNRDSLLSAAREIQEAAIAVNNPKPKTDEPSNNVIKNPQQTEYVYRCYNAKGKKGGFLASCRDETLESKYVNWHPTYYGEAQGVKTYPSLELAQKGFDTWNELWEHKTGGYLIIEPKESISSNDQFDTPKSDRDVEFWYCYACYSGKDHIGWAAQYKGRIDAHGKASVKVLKYKYRTNAESHLSEVEKEFKKKFAGGYLRIEIVDLPKE